MKKEKTKVNKIFSFSLFIALMFSIIITLILIIFTDQITKIFNLSPYYYFIVLPIVILYPIYLVIKGMFYGVDRVKDYIEIELISRFAFFIGLIIIVITKSYIILPFMALYLLFPILSLPRLNGALSSKNI